jgi:hypothetical protein
MPDPKGRAFLIMEIKNKLPSGDTVVNAVTVTEMT